MLHFKNWRRIEDIKPLDHSWTDVFHQFLKSDECPSFVKADIQKAKMKVDHESDGDEENLTDEMEMPDWMEILQPHEIYDDYCDDFKFDDGEDYNWAGIMPYPTNSKHFIDEIANPPDDDSLNIPDVDHMLLNSDQQFAFNLIISHLQRKHLSPLRLVVQGAAGFGKSYLISCLLKAIRLM